MPASTGGPGRPARYHSRACRARAYRARSAGRHGELLAGLGEVEAAVGELRRAVLAGQPTRHARARLVEAASEVARRLDDEGQAPEHAAASAPEDLDDVIARLPVDTRPLPDVAKYDDLLPSGRASSVRSAPAAASHDATRTVTEPVTETGAGSRPGRSVFSAGRVAPVDPDTVRLERITEPGAAGWRVLAGLAADPDTVVALGVLEPAYGAGRRAVRGWHAADSGLARVAGGPWRTRREAAVQLLAQHQRRASAHPSR